MNDILSAPGQGFTQNPVGVNAAVVKVDANNLTGRSFLAVDLDANGQFTATDFIIEITGSTYVGMTSASFIQ